VAAAGVKRVRTGAAEELVRTRGAFENDVALSANGDSIPPPDVSFGPQSGSGSANVNDYPGGYEIGNFFLTYQSILPDGMIDTSAGGAVADITLASDDPNGLPQIFYASFQTVPEPGSLAQAATGVLLTAIFACVRRFCSGRRSRP